MSHMNWIKTNSWLSVRACIQQSLQDHRMTCPWPKLKLKWMELSWTALWNSSAWTLTGSTRQTDHFLLSDSSLNIPWRCCKQLRQRMKAPRTSPIVTLMITDLVGPAPATTGWGKENDCSHSCGKGWQFKRVLDYARNPTPPSAAQTMGKRDCVYVTLTLHRTLEIGYATLTLYFE